MTSIYTTIRKWDTRMVFFLAEYRRGFFHTFMKILTRLGDGWLWVAFGFLIFFVDGDTARPFLIHFGLASCLNIILYRRTKAFFSRQRPFRKYDGISCELRLFEEHSFPSGHASAAFVAVSVTALFYGWLFLPVLAVAILMGLSRVYLGAHYPSDVVAGVLLGLFSAELARWMLLALDF